MLCSHFNRGEDVLRVVFHQVPQPWHPQSTLLHEAALAVEQAQPSAYSAMFAKLFDNRDRFTDLHTYEKTRLEIYQELAELAMEVGVDHDTFMKLLVLNMSGGKTNSGNGATGALKLVVKHQQAASMLPPLVL